MEEKNGLGQEEDKERDGGVAAEKERGREGVVVKLNDCSVRIIIDDSGSVNY